MYYLGYDKPALQPDLPTVPVEPEEPADDGDDSSDEASSSDGEAEAALLKEQAEARMRSGGEASTSRSIFFNDVSVQRTSEQLRAAARRGEANRASARVGVPLEMCLASGGRHAKLRLHVFT